MSFCRLEYRKWLNFLSKKKKITSPVSSVSRNEMTKDTNAFWSYFQIINCSILTWESDSVKMRCDCCRLFSFTWLPNQQNYKDCNKKKNRRNGFAQWLISNLILYHYPFHILKHHYDQFFWSQFDKMLFLEHKCIIPQEAFQDWNDKKSKRTTLSDQSKSIDLQDENYSN